MSRCKVCNRMYSMSFLARFPDEDYCPTCEWEIVQCLIELEDHEEVEDDHCT